jgi:hypothetical protein
MRGVRILAGMMMGLAACATSFAQTNYNEHAEPNDTKAQATIVGAMAPGDTLSGSTTGADSAGGATSMDTWDITTTAAPSAGIWRYRLTFSGGGWTGSIRGLSQTAGVIGTTDSAAQTATGANQTVQWYANQNPSRIYFRVTGTASTTTPYQVTLTRDQVVANSIPGTLDAGPIFITTIGQTTVNTDMWLYDSNFVAIANDGNNDESVAGGGAGTTLQSRLQRNLAPGTYILAIGNANIANNLANPSDDRTQTDVVMDFPNATCMSSATTGSDNDFVIGNRCTGASVSMPNVGGAVFDIGFWSFTLTGTQLPDPPTTFTAGVATPASVPPGNSTVLSVTVSGTAPTSVTGDLSAFGLSSTAAFHDDGQNGDATAGDGIWSYQLNVPAAQTGGLYNVNVQAAISGVCSSPTRIVPVGVNPPNNLCANAVPIVVGGAYPGSTLGAASAGGLAAACNTIVGTNPGVWYKFTEGATARRLVCSACDPVTNFDTSLALYTGTCGALTCVWGNQAPGFGCPYQSAARDSGPTGHTDIAAIINWNATGTPRYQCTVPGMTYYICVLNAGPASASGNFVLHLDDTGETCPTIPQVNNLCSGATPLTSFATFPNDTWTLVFRDNGAASPNIPSCSGAGNTGSRGSLWYSYTPTQNGNFYHVKIGDQSTAGGTLDTLVTVYSTASDCSALTEVACVDAVEGYSSTGMFNTPVAALTAGTHYLIEISQESATAAIPGGEYLGFKFVSTGPSPCCRSDFNGDGDIGTDLDIESFFACLAGNCCPTCPPTADFNCDGDIGTDTDIESFFRVLAGGAC